MCLAHESMGHAGVRSMKRCLNSRFNWPGVGKYMVDYVKSCATKRATKQATKLSGWLKGPLCVCH